MEQDGFHGQESIVAEILSRTKQNGRSRSLARGNEFLSSEESGYFAISMLVSLNVSPSTEPVTLT
jgi:hypothetical protein